MIIFALNSFRNLFDIFIILFNIDSDKKKNYDNIALEYIFIINELLLLFIVAINK